MQDLVEQLLPEAGRATAARARAIVTFLRLVANDATAARAGAAGLAHERAREEFERQEEGLAVRAIEDLLQAHLSAVLGSRSFLCFGPLTCTSQEAWSALEDRRTEQPRLPELPAPGESALSVARRLLAALEERAPASRRSAYWRAAMVRAETGAEAGAQSFLDALRTNAHRTLGERARLVVAAAACRLDRGAVRGARDLLEESSELAACEPEVARLLGWTALLLGRTEEAAEALRGLPPWPGPLPLALAELRGRRPEWGPWLLGADPAPAARSAGEPPSERPTSRSELGASAVLLCELDPVGTPQLCASDVAPGLRARIAEWPASRDGAVRRPAEPEHRLLATASPVLLHRTDAAPLRGALAGDSTHALALVPIAGRGVVSGYLWIEFEHHLLPPRERLEEFARSWCTDSLAESSPVRRSDAEPPRRPGLGPTGFELRPDSSESAADGRVGLLRELVGRLAMKTAQRRWWGFEWGEDGARLLWTEGGELESWRERPGRAGALQRAAACGGSVRFDDPDPELSVAVGSASGAVLPVVDAGQVRALVALESTRRRDFRDADLERWASAATGVGAAFRVAQFQAWQWSQLRESVYFDPWRVSSERGFSDLLAAARARRPVAVVGPPGTGKRVAACWVHFESARRVGPLLRFDCRGGTGEQSAAALFGAAGRPGLWVEARGGSLLLQQLDHLPIEVQLRLALEVEASDADPMAARLIATLGRPLARAVAAGALRAELATRLGSLELFLPPLSDRRAEVPALAQHLASRAASQEGLRPPGFTDCALACLWRQPWEGNVRELDQFVYKIALLHPGEQVDAAQLEQVAARFRLDLVCRLPSRHPDPGLLAAALEHTRKKCGAFNKTRAAMYLGWDPDTLVARMREAGLEPQPQDG